MTEDLEMKGSNLSLPPDGPVPCGISSGSAHYEPPEACPDSSDPSIEDRGAAVHSRQNSSQEAPEITVNHAVIRPYAIEEPDDDADPAAQRERPCLPDNFERWQRDLVDYMHRLDYDSGIDRAAKAHAKQARGQKRKSAITAGIGHYHSVQSLPPGPRTRPEAVQSIAPGVGVKRRRRRSKLLRGDPNGARSAFSLNDFRECLSTGSSSSDLRSNDVSSAGTTSESAIADDMDID